jgi:tRNA threonylcarbamoyl adenosine modification protein (Sua5/YciO/YrdC/YwlC family)
MSQQFSVHPTHPQARLLHRAADILRAGGIAVVPTDTTYALVCQIGDKAAVERIRQIRQLDARHDFTLVCRDLSELAGYARVDNTCYRILKHYTPGPFTFILRASREVPKRLIHPKKRTIGLRVPDHPVAQGLLEALGEPLISTTARLPGDEFVLADPHELGERLQSQVELVIDSGNCGLVPTTVVDLTDAVPVVVRQGLGEF